MAAAQRRHADRQLVPLTGDELRAFHPRYQKLLDGHPLLFPNVTAQASEAWMRMSIEHARDHGYSLILEGVFRDPEMTVATAREFAAAHRVELVWLGVRAERSRLDSLHRYLEAGRWTPPTAHDSAYRRMPQTLAAAERSPDVQRVTLTDRTKVPAGSRPAVPNAEQASHLRRHGSRECLSDHRIVGLVVRVAELSDARGR
ncbi:hypothetical protein BJP40_00535 [Streptomyces sp. CC53]|nr:hypothetical protein BJP40_00535 [Streptomyces sp. CC53]